MFGIIMYYLVGIISFLIIIYLLIKTLVEFYVRANSPYSLKFKVIMTILTIAAVIIDLTILKLLYFG